MKCLGLLYHLTERSNLCVLALSSVSGFISHCAFLPRRLHTCYLVCLESSISGLCSDFTLLWGPSLTPLYKIIYPCPSWFITLHCTHYHVMYFGCLFSVCLSYTESKHLQSRDFGLFYSLPLPHLLQLSLLC